jgi:SAM-dependent methyltransferase
MMDPEFWESHYQRFSVTEPSAFAKYCVDRWIQKDDVVIEIGCGNGRDGMFLAEHCSEYFAVDSSAKAIEQFSKRLSAGTAKVRVNLHCGDVADFNFRQPTPQPGGKIVVYSRFSLHSLDEATEQYVLNQFAQLGAGSVLALEARTIFDPLHGVGTEVGRNAYVTDHYRRFIDPRDLLEFAMTKTAIKYFVLSDGFAMTETENPIVMRAVMSNQGTSNS